MAVPRHTGKKIVLFGTELNTPSGAAAWIRGGDEPTVVDAMKEQNITSYASVNGTSLGLTPNVFGKLEYDDTWFGNAQSRLEASRFRWKVNSIKVQTRLNPQNNGNVAHRVTLLGPSDDIDTHGYTTYKQSSLYGGNSYITINLDILDTDIQNTSARNAWFGDPNVFPPDGATPSPEANVGYAVWYNKEPSAKTTMSTGYLNLQLFCHPRPTIL